MEKSIGRLVSILYRKNQVYLNLALKPLNITATELPIITYLFHHNGVSQEELSSFLLIDKASTARAVQTLLDKDFIRKEKNITDRRANQIFLTEVGHSKKDRITEVLLQWTNFLTEGLDENSIGITLTVLESMVNKVENIDFKEIWGNK